MSRLSLLARSLTFNALFYANLLVHMIAALPTLVLPAGHPVELDVTSVDVVHAF